MVLELESLSASLKVALELPELRTIGVVGQVPLELRQVWELLGADRARLKQGQVQDYIFVFAMLWLVLLPVF